MLQNTTERMKSSNLYFPEFGGSTGGWLEAAEKEEKYVMTWTNTNKSTKVEDNIFEMPTGGAAIMKMGPNLVYMARKEQCLALGKQLGTKFKVKDYRILEFYQVEKFNLYIQKMVFFLKKLMLDA